MIKISVGRALLMSLCLSVFSTVVYLIYPYLGIDPLAGATENFIKCMILVIALWGYTIEVEKSGEEPRS